jgi:hypothetical protein
MIDRKKEIERKRKEANRLLVERMRNGDALQFSAEMTYFPPRPIIQKDKKAMAKCYNKPEEGEKCEQTKEESPS